MFNIKSIKVKKIRIAFFGFYILKYPLDMDISILFL